MSGDRKLSRWSVSGLCGLLIFACFLCMALVGYADGGARLWKNNGGTYTIWIGGIYEVRGSQTLCHIYAGGQRSFAGSCLSRNDAVGGRQLGVETVTTGMFPSAALLERDAPIGGRWGATAGRAARQQRIGAPYQRQDQLHRCCLATSV